jgi:hypothetical protein
MASVFLSIWLVLAPYNCPSGAECRSDADCGECYCVDGYCDG